MRRLTAVLTAAILAIALAGPASAANGGHGFMPPNARAHGHSLTQLAAAWDLWAFGTAADDNPLLAKRCEPSPLDSRVWFLPVSLGGDYAVDCAIPNGAFLVLTPGGYECSAAEGNGSTQTELQACADAGFALITEVELALDGAPVKHLERYVVTSPIVSLPGSNLLSDDPTPSLIKGYFLVLAPLSHGQHTLRAFDAFASIGLTAGITYNITVGGSAKRH
jgi:hypothetical protein